MSDEVESVENLAGDGLPAPGIDTLLRFQGRDGAVVEPPGGDRDCQCRCVSRCCVDCADDLRRCTRSVWSVLPVAVSTNTGSGIQQPGPKQWRPLDELGRESL